MSLVLSAEMHASLRAPFMSSQKFEPIMQELENYATYLFWKASAEVGHTWLYQSGGPVLLSILSHIITFISCYLVFELNRLAPQLIMKPILYSINALLVAIISCAATPTDAAERLEARKKSFDCEDKLVVNAFSKYSSLASSLCSSYVPATTTTEVVVS